MTDMKNEIIIIGNAVTAEIIYQLISKDATLKVAAFAVNAAYIQQPTLFDKPVCPLENLNKKYPPEKYKIINAVGYSNVNQTRESTFNQAKQQGYQALTYIHQSASVFSENISEGVFIMPGAIVEPYSTLAENVMVWSNAVIAHNAVIEEHCWIASGCVVAGHATIKKNSFLGINASVVNQITIEEYNIIGANTLVSKNTNPNTVLLSRTGEPHRFDSKTYAKFYGF